MSLKDLRYTSGEDILNKVQDNVDTALRPIIGSAIISGVLLNNVSLINGATVVNHKLGKKLQGYIVVKKSANANIWDGAANTSTITLHSDAACTVSLWCF